jgi:hypothetical protein
MKNALGSFVSWIVILGLLLTLSLVATGCRSIPKVERCLIGDAGCVCIDSRKPEGQREYILPFSECRNYIATNPDDYFTLEEWMQRRCR